MKLFSRVVTAVSAIVIALFCEQAQADKCSDLPMPGAQYFVRKLKRNPGFSWEPVCSVKDTDSESMCTKLKTSPVDAKDVIPADLDARMGGRAFGAKFGCAYLFIGDAYACYAKQRDIARAKFKRITASISYLEYDVLGLPTRNLGGLDKSTWITEDEAMTYDPTIDTGGNALAPDGFHDNVTQSFENRIGRLEAACEAQGVQCAKYIAFLRTRIPEMVAAAREMYQASYAARQIDKALNKQGLGDLRFQTPKDYNVNGCPEVRNIVVLNSSYGGGGAEKAGDAAKKGDAGGASIDISGGKAEAKAKPKRKPKPKPKATQRPSEGVNIAAKDSGDGKQNQDGQTTGVDKGAETGPTRFDPNARTSGADDSKEGHSDGVEKGHGTNSRGNTLKDKNRDFKGGARTQNDLDYDPDGKGRVTNADNTRPVIAPRNSSSWSLTSREAPHCAEHMGRHNVMCLGTGLENDLLTIGKNKALMDSFCEKEVRSAIDLNTADCDKRPSSTYVGSLNSTQQMFSVNPAYATRFYDGCAKIKPLLAELKKPYGERKPQDAACQLWFKHLNGQKDVPNFGDRKTVTAAYHDDGALNGMLHNMADFVEDGARRDLGAYSVIKRAQFLYAISVNINSGNVSNHKAVADSILKSASCLNPKEQQRVRDGIAQASTALQKNEEELKGMQGKWVIALVQAAKDFERTQTKMKATKRLMKQKGCFKLNLEKNHRLMCDGFQTSYDGAESEFTEVANSYPILQEELSFVKSKDDPTYIRVNEFAKIYHGIDEEELNTKKGKLWKWLSDSTLQPNEAYAYAKLAARKVLSTGHKQLEDVCKEGLHAEGQRAADIYPLIEGYLSCEDIESDAHKVECAGRKNAAWSLCRTQSDSLIKAKREQMKNMLKMMAMAAGGAIATVLTAGGASVLAAVVGIGMSSYSVATGIHDYVTHDSAKMERQAKMDFNNQFTDYETFKSQMDAAEGPSLTSTIVWSTLDVVFMGLDVAAIGRVIKDGAKSAQVIKAVNAAKQIDDPVSRMRFLDELREGRVTEYGIDGRRVVAHLTPEEVNEVRKLIDKGVQTAAKTRAKKEGVKTASAAPTASGTIRAPKKKPAGAGAAAQEDTVVSSIVVTDEIHSPTALPEAELAKAETSYRKVKNQTPPKAPASKDPAELARYNERLREWGRKQADAASDLLEASGVAHYKVIEDGETIILIKPVKNGHPLNEYAHKMLTEHGVDGIVYAPENLSRIGGKAAYRPGDNLIVVSNDVIHGAPGRENPFDDVDLAHEGDHALLAKQAKEGKTSGFYGSGWILNADGRLPFGSANDGYYDFMSFSEMHTHWGDIGRNADKVFDGLVAGAGASRHPNFHWRKLSDSFKHTEIVTKRAKLMAEDALDVINKHPKLVTFKEGKDGVVLAYVTIPASRGKSAYMMEFPLAGSKGLGDARNLDILKQQLSWTKQVAADRILLLEQAQRLAVIAIDQPLKSQLGFIAGIKKLTEPGNVKLPWEAGYTPVTHQSAIAAADNAYHAAKAKIAKTLPRNLPESLPLDKDISFSLEGEQYFDDVAKAKPATGSGGRAKTAQPYLEEVPHAAIPAGHVNSGTQVAEGSSVLYRENGEIRIAVVKRVGRDPITRKIKVRLSNGETMAMDELGSAVVEAPRAPKRGQSWSSLGKSAKMVEKHVFTGSGGKTITIDDSTTIALADGRIVRVEEIRVAGKKFAIKTHEGDILTQSELDRAFFESVGPDGKPVHVFGPKHKDGQPILLTNKKNPATPDDDEIIELTPDMIVSSGSGSQVAGSAASGPGGKVGADDLAPVNGKPVRVWVEGGKSKLVDRVEGNIVYLEDGSSLPISSLMTMGEGPKKQIVQNLGDPNLRTAGSRDAPTRVVSYDAQTKVGTKPARPANNDQTIVLNESDLEPVDTPTRVVSYDAKTKVAPYNKRSGGDTVELDESDLKSVNGTSKTKRTGAGAAAPRRLRSGPPSLTNREWARVGDHELDEAWTVVTKNKEEAQVGDTVILPDGSESKIVLARRDPKTGRDWVELKNGDVVEADAVTAKAPPTGPIGEADVGSTVLLQGGTRKTIKEFDEKRKVVVFTDGTEIPQGKLERQGLWRNKKIVETAEAGSKLKKARAAEALDSARTTVNLELEKLGYSKDKIEKLSDVDANRLLETTRDIFVKRERAKGLRKFAASSDADAHQAADLLKLAAKHEQEADEAAKILNAGLDCL